MTQAWDELDRELTLWSREGLDLPLWWRDDDAVAPTEALGRLEDLAGELGMPVHLAVIPHSAVAELAETVSQSQHLLPVVHGWAHVNHAPTEAKKSEFGSTRPVDEALNEAEQGIERLQQLFGPALRPMFVPPWNRISAAMLPWLAGLDYAAISTFGPRKRVQAAPGLLQINTHIDPINWHGDRSLLDSGSILTPLVAQLQARRAGSVDRTEPLGLLTHHLIHDEGVWSFCETLLRRLLDGPARPWRFDERIT
ncbi:polysaccharide deacetylase family protein [Phaeobacter sp. B1627]|uniref:polysaccharide deacetylase family protein n=1 Tax=Phaeobacter sp. B1627 TaxID=2583809 RepID=UPI00111A88F9|nr:polysaccharide deacetylase family protein [Phaeobacter sp. B1627]TNJ47731.1 polysaccharide deacetylase [Phaeobacter sp. B1627]